MKTICITAIAMFAFLSQETRLKGTYTVIYDKGQQGYQITFADSTYVKKMPDAITYKGLLKYEKYKVTIRKNVDDDPIEIDHREINKDTIKFTTKSKRDLSMIINRGRMIKIK